MKEYYLELEQQLNGINVIHEEGCIFISQDDNKISLGNHPTCHMAVVTAKRRYSKADGCSHCCTPCHYGVVEELEG